MALVLADRVRETTTVTGTGTATLLGAAPGYQSFSAVGNANTTYYVIANQSASEWEVGIGTYTSSGTTLSRDTVLSSSNSGSLVNFSAGTKDVFVDYPASKAVYENAAGNVNGYPITGGTINNTTIGATTPAAGTFTTLTAQTEVLKGTGQNFLLHSQNFTNAVWQNTNSTATNNTTVAPDGTTTAGTITTSVSSANYFKQNLNVTAGQVYTFSFYALRGTATDMKYSVYNNTGSADILAPTSYYSSTNSSTWSRISVTFTTPSGCTNAAIYIGRDSASTGTFFVWGAQVELAQTAGVYLVTTTTAVYGTPTLSFSGVASIGLQSDGSLFVQPTGTGAVQAQATTSTTAGGNARGANAVDWQTSRTAANQVASAGQSVIGGGSQNIASGQYAVAAGGVSNGSGSFASVVSGGWNNFAVANNASIVGGYNNSASGIYSFIGGGQSNTSAGYYNFIGNGFTNSGTALAAVTTQSATMNGTTAVTLSGSNASIKVGQYISGTSIGADTYVAAISGTSLTLSKVASGSSTSTLSFYTPHGVVVGGGNNQATGSYSFIGGGGDAGTAAQRNTASGPWSTVVGGWNNTASGEASFIGGGGSYGGGPGGSVASALGSSVLGGYSNVASGAHASVLAGGNNTASGAYSAAIGGYNQTTRGITGITVFGSRSSFGSTNGQAQNAIFTFSRQTTDATASVLTCDSSTTPSGINQVILPNNAAYFFTGEVVSGVTGGGNTKGWKIEGVIKRGANAASTTLVGSTVTSTYADAGASTWVIAVTADTTNGGLAVTFTGQASTTIRTVAQIRTTEMTY